MGSLHKLTNNIDCKRNNRSCDCKINEFFHKSSIFLCIRIWFTLFCHWLLIWTYRTIHWSATSYACFLQILKTYFLYQTSLPSFDWATSILRKYFRHPRSWFISDLVERNRWNIFLRYFTNVITVSIYRLFYNLIKKKK